MCRLNSYLRSLKKTEPTLPLRITTLSYDIGKATAVEFFRVTHAQPHAHTPVKSEGKGKKKKREFRYYHRKQKRKKKGQYAIGSTKWKGRFPPLFFPFEDVSLLFSRKRKKEKPKRDTETQTHTSLFCEIKKRQGHLLFGQAQINSTNLTLPKK